MPQCQNDAANKQLNFNQNFRTLLGYENFYSSSWLTNSKIKFWKNFSKSCPVIKFCHTYEYIQKRRGSKLEC